MVTSNDITADPIEVYRRECLSLIENLSPEVYEKNEEEFHRIRDELKTLCGEESNKNSELLDGVEDPLSDKKSAKKKCKSCGCVGCKCASRRKASTVVKSSPWKIVKSSLKRVASNAGKYGTGEWETSVNDYGKALDLLVNTRLNDGTPLVANTITFSLIHENPKTRVATVEVFDPVLTNKKHEISLPTKKVGLFAKLWAKNAIKAAKEFLKDN